MCSCADFEGYTPETHGLCPQRVDSILRQNSDHGDCPLNDDQWRYLVADPLHLAGREVIWRRRLLGATFFIAEETRYCTFYGAPNVLASSCHIAFFKPFFFARFRPPSPQSASCFVFLSSLRCIAPPRWKYYWTLWLKSCHYARLLRPVCEWRHDYREPLAWSLSAWGSF